MADPKDPKKQESDAGEPSFLGDLTQGDFVPSDDIVQGDNVESGDGIDFSQSLEELNLGEPAPGADAATPIEELDFSEPSGFAFPDQSEGVAPQQSEVAGEVPAAESMFVAEDGGAVEAGVVEPVLADAGVVEAELDDGVETPAAEEESPVKKTPAWMAYVDWAVMVLVVAAIVLLCNLLTAAWWWHASYLVLLVEIPFSLWKTRKVWTTPQLSAVYTVMLAIGTMALLTGVYWLGLELATYDWDCKAKTARRTASATLPNAAQFGPANATAAAWPMGIQVMDNADAAVAGIGPSWITEMGHFGSACS